MGRYVITVLIALTLGALGGATVGTPLADHGGVAVGALAGALVTAWIVARQPDIQASIYFEKFNPAHLTPDEGAGVLLSDLLETGDIESRLDAIEASLRAIKASATGRGQ